MIPKLISSIDFVYRVIFREFVR